MGSWVTLTFARALVEKEEQGGVEEGVAYLAPFHLGVPLEFKCPSTSHALQSMPIGVPTIHHGT